MNVSFGDERQKKYVIFLHIPKAAGTTLNSVITLQYGRKAIFQMNGLDSRHEFEKLPQRKREKIKVFRGHMLFGLHTFLERPCTYFTLLRHPVNRVISLYYYHRRNPTLKQHPLAKTLSLKDWVIHRSQSGITSISNGQTRHLCGLSDVEWDNEGQVLEAARRNLEKYFCVVGIMEKFDETLILLKKTLGWKIPVYVKHNVRKSAGKKESVSPETLKLIEEHNQLDFALYQLAREKFAQSIATYGDSFYDDLNTLQLVNRICQPVGKTYYFTRRLFQNYISQ